MSSLRPATNPCADEFQAVTDKVAFWETYDPAVKAYLGSSAVATARGLVFIDPIRLAPEAMEELLETMPAPHAIVLTNGHHWRAAEEYRRRFDIPIHAAAEAAEEGTPDTLLEDGALVAGELRVMTLPGAGPGELALRHTAGSLHVGDALVNLEATGFAFLPDKYCLDPKGMRESLRKLLREDFALLLFAHGTPVVSQARERLALLLA